MHLSLIHILPARNARHARLFTWDGAMNLKNAKYETDGLPIDPQCDCPVCRRYSRAYLRHLFKAEEMHHAQPHGQHLLCFKQVPQIGPGVQAAHLSLIHISSSVQVGSTTVTV